MISKFLPHTIGRYFARLYLLSFLQLLGILLAIVYLFDTVELLRRAAKFQDVPLSLVLQMGFFKLPEVGQIVLPFAILFSALYTFWLLTRRHELEIVRSAGLSVWQFISPIIGVALLIGVFHIMVVNPVGALLIGRYEALEKTYLRAEDQTASVGEQGLWLRQKTEEGGIVLHAAKVKVPEWRLGGVTVYYFSKTGQFLRRLDAPSALLEQGSWKFTSATLNENENPPRPLQQASLPSPITVKEIEESFATAEETPFWSLPSYIRTMEATGFDSRRLRIHFQSLLAQPLLFAAMVILAATVSLRAVRSNPTFLMIAGGVAIGFVFYFLSSFLKALGASDQIPVMVAAWFPPLIALSLGISVILTTEDG
jgi:lipopolysaccharide export system permease protein